MKNKQKLTIVSISGINNFVGGAETFNFELCRHLNKYGHKIINLSAVPKNEGKKNKLIKDEYYYKLGKRNIFDINILGIINLFIKLYQITSSRKIDIIYLHLYLPPLTLAIFSNYFKIPKIIHTYGVWWQEFESFNSANLNHINKISFKKYKVGLFARKVLQKFMLSKADGIIALSSFHKNQIIKAFKTKEEKIEIIGGAVNYADFFPAEISRSELKKRMGFSNKKIAIIVSRIEPRKGILEAIEAMSYVTKKEDALLIIISPHYDGTFLKYLASCYKAVSKYNLGGKILFKTGLTKSQLRPYYQMSDCFIMSSTSLETFGLTIMEAIQSGTPVIGARSGNITNILESIDPILLVDKPTPKLFAKKILQYFSLPPNKKQKLINDGVSLAKSFTWESKAKELEEYFYQIKSTYSLRK